MKKYILTLVLFLSIASLSYAQEYQTALGLRGGFSNGVTVKHFIGEKSAVEGIFTTRWSGVNVTGLYEIHKWRAFDVNRLNWYYGFGGHIGFWDGSRDPWDGSSNYMVIGADLILGLEYNFEEIPINLSVDWKPAFNIIGASGFWPDAGAFSARYMF